MMFGLGSFNLINEFERAFNELNAEQLASSSARLQPYLTVFKTNIMSFNTPLTCGSIPTREKSNKANKVFYGLSNQQMRNKLQREVSNPRPLTIPSFDTVLNN